MAAPFFTAAGNGVKLPAAAGAAIPCSGYIGSSKGGKLPCGGYSALRRTSYFAAMKRLRKLANDPSFYCILALNLYLLEEYRQNPASYNTLIWIYWCQSVMIGLFNALDIWTTPNADTSNFKFNDKPVKGNNGCVPLFFLLHYGFFHLVYFIFLKTDDNIGNIDMPFLKSALLWVLCSQVIIFIQHKFYYRQHPPSLGTQFFLPYLRVIPIHFTILIPAFTGLKPSLVFVILRTVFDIVGYIITSPRYRQAEPTVEIQ